MIEFIPYDPDFYEDWFRMSKELFPNYDPTQLQRDLQYVLESDRQATFLAMLRNEAIGFANVSVRIDYVEGSTSRPVGYLEAVYVRPDCRKQGVARGLLAIAERWARRRGCTQMGSDTWVDNIDSREFHERNGFQEDDILVHYIKDIRPE